MCDTILSIESMTGVTSLEIKLAPQIRTMRDQARLFELLMGVLKKRRFLKFRLALSGLLECVTAIKDLSYRSAGLFTFIFCSSVFLNKPSELILNC